METIYISKGKYDNMEGEFATPCASLEIAESLAHEFDSHRVEIAYMETGAPRGYVREWNGHAPYTYIRDDHMVIGIYPPYDADHPEWTGAGEALAWYVVGRDGEDAIYSGPHPALAYHVAETEPMDEIVH